jgi:hypothetical protein
LEGLYISLSPGVVEGLFVGFKGLIGCSKAPLLGVGRGIGSLLRLGQGCVEIPAP